MADAVVFVIRAKDEFDRTLKKLARGVKTTGKATKDAATFGKDAFERLGKKMSGLSSIASRTASRVKSSFQGAFRAVGTAAKIGFGAIIAGAAAVGIGLISAAKAASSFQKAMFEVWTLTDWNRDQLHDMSREALVFSTRFSQAPVDIAQGMYSLISGSRQGRGEMKLLESTIDLADAGLSNMGDTMKLMTSFLGSFGFENEKAAYAADLLFTTIKEGQTRMDWLIQYAPKLFTPIRAAGVDIGQGMAAFATLTAAMGENLNPEAVTGLANAIEKLYARKLTDKAPKWLSDLIGKVKKQPLVEAMGTIKKFVDQFETQQERFYYATLIAGEKRAGAAILTLIGNYETFIDKVKKMTPSAVAGAAGEAASKIRQMLDYQWDKMKTSIQALKISIGTVLLPGITSVAEAIGSWAAELAKVDFTEVWKGFLSKEAISGEMGELVSYIKDQLTSALDPTTLVGSLFYGLADMVSGIAKVIWIPIETEAVIMFNRLMALVKAMFFAMVAEVSEEMAGTWLGRRMGVTKETTKGLREQVKIAGKEAVAWGPEGEEAQKRRTEGEKASQLAIDDLKTAIEFNTWATKQAGEAFKTGLRERVSAVGAAQKAARLPEVAWMAPGQIGGDIDQVDGQLAVAETALVAKEETTRRLTGSIIEFGGKVYSFAGTEIEIMENALASIEEIGVRQDELEARLETIKVTSENLRETSGRRSYSPAAA